MTPIKQLFLPIILLCLLSLLAGCAGQGIGSTEKGALTGTAIGSGIGAILGNQSGRAGEGVAIGAGLGAVAGGLMGRSRGKSTERTAEQDERMRRQQLEIDRQRRELEELKRDRYGDEYRKSDPYYGRDEDNPYYNSRY